MRILVTGANGMLGSAVVNAYGVSVEVFSIARQYGDLCNGDNVSRMIADIGPEVVVHCAAKVGGIHANMSEPDKFFTQNILMNTHVIHQACLQGVPRVISFSSVCAYDQSGLEINEYTHQDGSPHDTNFAYAYAKRMIEIQMRAYSRRYPTKLTCIVPTNMYGPNDNFDMKCAHVIPMLIRKCIEAKTTGRMEVWGDGSAEREFLYAPDLAEIVREVSIMESPPHMLVVSDGRSICMRTVVDTIKSAVGYDGEISYDSGKPAGQSRRVTDTYLFKSLFPQYMFTPFSSGIRDTVRWYLSSSGSARE